jgi:hypothetical protein
MATTPSPLSNDQWLKVLKAAAYSFGSGFVGGFVLALSGLLTSIVNGGTISLSTAAVIAVVLAGVVGGLNTLAVFLKQLYTEPKA